jgi:ATP-dependent DNA ligase
MPFILRGRAVHCFSRPGRELHGHAGMAWRELAWPVDAAVLDGEAVAGDGQEGIQSVFGKRGRPGGAMALVAFDVLQLDGVDVMDAAGLWDCGSQRSGGDRIVLNQSRRARAS